MAQKEPLRLKIVAAPIGPDGSYRAWPDKKTHLRRRKAEGLRDDQWRHFVVTKNDEHGDVDY